MEMFQENAQVLDSHYYPAISDLQITKSLQEEASRDGWPNKGSSMNE